MRTVHWVAALLVLSLPAVGWAETHAVLIGIDKYDNPDVTPLRYTVNDVKAFRDLLVDAAYGGANSENVVLMVPEAERGLRPTRAGILLQIKKAALRTRPDDTLILYFAGHGMETAEGRFLLGVDTDPLLLSDTAVPVDRLPAILADVKASKILVIVDACRNDPASGRAQADNPMGEAFERGLRPRILAPDAGGGPRQVATWLACGVGQRAWEYSQHEHGVFSYYLLEGLRGAAAADGEVSLGALAEHVAKAVAEWARRNGKEQDPKLDNPDRLELILTRPRRPRPGGVQEIPLGTVRVESEPPGATVLVDGEPQGKTPCDVSLPLPDGQNKKVTVQLQLDGYEPAAAGVELVAGEAQTWSKALNKRSLPAADAGQPVVPDEQRPPDQPAQPITDGGNGWLPSWKQGPDGLPMVAVEGGSVSLGTDDPNAEIGHRPRHQVSLSAYQIHAVEVTNQAFANTLNRMLLSGGCAIDGDGNVVTTEASAQGWPSGLVLMFTSSPSCAVKFGAPRGGPIEPAGVFGVTPGHENLPATPVTWFGASLYAAWNQMRLPTEAEWERAAQARDASQPYPWGGQAISTALANVESHQLAELVEVAALRTGASAVGCLNMLGNVWEWTADRYVQNYHQLANGIDPQIGFQPGEYVEMTLRGGGYRFPGELTNVYTRSPAAAGGYAEDYGFRCVLPSQPTTNIIVPAAEGGKPNRGGGKPAPTDDDVPWDDDEVEPAAHFYPHPLNGTQIAIPEDWEAMPQQNGAVVISDDEGASGVFYYYCPPHVNTPELALAAVVTDLQLNGIQIGQSTGTQVLTFTTPRGTAQLFRQSMGVRMDDQLGYALIDIVLQNGILHGLVYIAEEDVFEDDMVLYRTVLERTVYP